MGLVRRRWTWLVAAATAGLLLGLLHTLLATASYRTSASVFFSLQYGDSASELVQGSTYAQDQVSSFARLATTPAVLQPVIEELDLNLRPQQLAARVEASAPVDTVIVEIAVTDPSPERSARIADAVAAQLSTTVEFLAPQDEQGDPTVRALTVADAEIPHEAASPDLLQDLALGLLAGALLGVVAIAGRAALDTRVQDPAAVAAVTDLPVVGTVGVLPAGSPVVVESAPNSPAAEAFRQLRTNLQFLQVTRDVAADAQAVPVRVVMVTSSVPDEGKSTVAANLAATLAETGSRVLLVDADLRRPSVARLLGLEGAAGLTTVLLGRATVADVAQEWGSSGLDVLTSGPVPPNPSELLASPALRRLLGDLRPVYDVVVVDAPPLLPVADAAILSHAVDGTFVVANARRVHRHQLREGLANLTRVRATVLGVVLNQVRRDETAYTYSAEGAAGHAAVAPGPVVVADPGPTTGGRAR